MRDTLSADLLARHLATEVQVAEAYRAHAEDGGAFPTRLVQAGVRPGDVLMALARISSLTPVPGSRLRFPERGIGEGLDPAPFWKLMAAPFGRVGDELLVAFADPATIPLAGPEGVPLFRAHVGLETDVRMALRALFASSPPLPRVPPPLPPPPPPTSEESETLEIELEAIDDLAEGVEVDVTEEGSELAAALVAAEGLPPEALEVDRPLEGLDALAELSEAAELREVPEAAEADRLPTDRLEVQPLDPSIDAVEVTIEGAPLAFDPAPAPAPSFDLPPAPSFDPAPSFGPAPALDPDLEAALESPSAASAPSAPVAVVSFAARRKLVPGSAVRAPLKLTPGPAELLNRVESTPREERTGLWAIPLPPPAVAAEDPPSERPREERTGLWAMPVPPPAATPDAPPPERPREERTGLWAMPAAPPAAVPAPGVASDRTGVWELPAPPPAAPDRTGVWENPTASGAPNSPSGPERTGIWAGAAVSSAPTTAGPRVVGAALLPPDGAPSVAATQEKLAIAASEGDVAATLVTFAAAWFPRTLVLARREGELRGLLGRGLGRPSYDVAALRIKPELLQPSYGPGPIGPALDALWRVYGGLPQALLVREVPAETGEPWVLLGDVPNVSARYHDLHPLELVLHAAGAALDRISHSR